MTRSLGVLYDVVLTTASVCAGATVVPEECGLLLRAGRRRELGSELITARDVLTTAAAGADAAGGRPAGMHMHT